MKGVVACGSEFQEENRGIAFGGLDGSGDAVDGFSRCAGGVQDCPGGADCPCGGEESACPGAEDRQGGCAAAAQEFPHGYGRVQGDDQNRSASYPAGTGKAPCLCLQLFFRAGAGSHFGCKADIILPLEKEQLSLLAGQGACQVYRFDEDKNVLLEPVLQTYGKVRTEEELLRQHGAH